MFGGLCLRCASSDRHAAHWASPSLSCRPRAPSAADRLLRALRGEGVLPCATAAILARQHRGDCGSDTPDWSASPAPRPDNPESAVWVGDLALSPEQRGLLALGVPLGSPAFIESHLQQFTTLNSDQLDASFVLRSPAGAICLKVTPT